MKGPKMQISEIHPSYVWCSSLSQWYYYFKANSVKVLGSDNHEWSSEIQRRLSMKQQALRNQSPGTVALTFHRWLSIFKNLFQKSRALCPLLLSEIPRSTCAKLRTTAASKIEIMLAISLTIACSHCIHNGVILHAHPVRGEPHNQRNTTGEVATP